MSDESGAAARRPRAGLPNPVTDEVIARLEAALPTGTRKPVEPHYLEEPRGRWAGQAGVLMAPRSTDEVARIVAIAAEARVGVVPYGGGTGLVAGQVAYDGPAPILLSLERMNRIRSVHAGENLIVVEAGAILADVQAAAAEADRLFPLSYGSEGSARIGGALSVNSGGLNVLRYGNARDLCLGIEAVLPDGSVWHGLKRLRKDNTGYDLRGLMIGAEGTLGVITAAVLRLFPRPTRRGTAIMVVPDPEAALALLTLARAHAGEAVSAFELISGQGLSFLDEAQMGLRQPFDPVPGWCVLTEFGTTGSADPDALIEAVFSEALEAGLVSDGIIAQSEAQRAEMWALREAIPLANKEIGAVASHDISLPLDEITGFMARAEDALVQLGDMRINAFGHLGDGNLHYNVFPANGAPASAYDNLRGRVSELVHDLAVELGGSFSAEHGIGRLKVGELERYGDPAKLAAMRAIKSALDPGGIMNPGAVLRPSE